MKLAVLCSLTLSILHSILFYGQKWGISVFLFTTVGIFFLIQILEKNQKIKNKKALLLSIPIILLSATYFIFNHPFFNFFNMVVIVLLFLIMVIFATIGTLKINTILENIFILIFGPAEEIQNATREISNCFSNKKKVKEQNHPILWKQIGKGILYSLPLLILVTILLITADSMFASIFENIFSKIFHIINLQTIYGLFFRILIIFALTLYFLGMILKIKNNELTEEGFASNIKIKVEGITFNTLLTLLNLIYLLFTMTQAIYLIEQMKSLGEINYAQYARTGFFQLMAVSIINFAVILISKKNTAKVSNSVKKYTKVMNVFLAIFTVVLLVCSVIRMNLYAQEYGYTFLRLMVYFIQLTELILIIPTMFYIVKEKFSILKWYAVISISMYVLVNFMNVDIIIAKRNIDRYFKEVQNEKNKIDFSYLSEKTSTDAIPEIIRLLDTKDQLLKTRVHHYLLAEYKELKEEKQSFPSWNLSKERAKKELEKLNLQNSD